MSPLKDCLERINVDCLERIVILERLDPDIKGYIQGFLQYKKLREQLREKLRGIQVLLSRNISKITGVEEWQIFHIIYDLNQKEEI